ncbi:MAG: DUF3310 domain-containing protein [Prevotella sp.]|nr:DUF3310 domain-containing protein [Prevotella sp.]
MEYVNHPKHYNQHPNGIECIDIIRRYTCDIANAIKYLWRAGNKAEMGKEDAEKEVEDLKKALWYIEDYRSHFCRYGLYTAVCMGNAEYSSSFKELTGHTIEDVCSVYPSPVKEAMQNLLRIGLIHNGGIAVCSMYIQEVSAKCIEQRILDISADMYYR